MRRHRPQRVQGDRGEFTMVPLMQALAIAGALGVLGFVAGLLAAYWLRLPWQVPCLSGLIGTGVVGPVIVIAFTTRVHRLLVWSIEDTLQLDVDRDGEIGEPEDTTEGSALVYVHKRNTKPPRTINQVGRARFRDFLRAIYHDGEPTTWRHWEAKDMSRLVWDEYTKRLIKAGVAERDGATSPLEPVATFREALDTFRELL